MKKTHFKNVYIIASVQISSFIDFSPEYRILTSKQ
jgi:hypothetical protein